MHTLFTPCYFAAIVFSPLQKCISVLGLHLISICTLLPLDHQEKFLCIFGICGCSHPTSHCRALKTSPRLVSTTIYTLLKLWQCGTRRWPDKESKDWEHIFVKQDRFSCLGKLHSLHKWFSFAMRMKVWS